MSEMVERVARAIQAELRNQKVLHEEGEDTSVLMLTMFCAADLTAVVRAAIEAMREPTEQMAYIGSWAVGPGGDKAKKAELAKAYVAMIDAALAPEQQKAPSPT